MKSFDWKGLAVGVTGIIVVVGTALLVMSPVKNIDPVAAACLGYESNWPTIVFVTGMIIGFIIGSIFIYTLTGKKEVKQC